MPSKRDLTFVEDFTPPGLIAVTPAALQFARDFAEAIRGMGDQVVTFDWAQSITLRRSPDAKPENIGSCMTLGAYKRKEVPPGFTQIVDGLEFAVRIPHDTPDRSGYEPAVQAGAAIAHFTAANRAPPSARACTSATSCT